MHRLSFLAALLLSIIISPAAWAEVPGSLSFCGERVQLNRNEVYQAVDQNLVLLSESKSRVWLSLKRSGRYLALVEGELRKANLPDDLKYIPFSLTGFDPLYNSGGRGMWRLRESEARAMGLAIDKDIDQRLDPVASSAAAARRLAALENVYGNWTTAMAAFLIGDDRMREAALAAGGQRDFYDIYLPGGAENLPAMVLAGKIVFSNPQAFGYRVSGGSLWPASSGQRATVQATTTARALASQYGLDYKSFRDLNPHLISGDVPAGTSINLP